MEPSRRSLIFRIAPALGVAAGSLAIPSIASADDPGLDEQGIHEGIDYIESIPDSALVSQEAFDSWKQENPVVSPRGAVGCGIAITTAFVSNALVVSKVLKIKAAIKAAGGAKKFADLLITGFKVAKAEGKSNSAAIKFAAQEAAAIGGSEALTAILEVLSVAGVAEKCFGVDL
ncbi:MULTISPECIES: hypothetical protein [Micrococcales]|uniref:Uncharacterized protein n=1 Tax=Brachybacterium fresconis TaxID=173363 RepID=A0ABS4YJ47_9MICO|nr:MULTISPECIES: hypothetical protein [Micrococcales]MBP2408820.1 hypothetical protein [Brachybacterium fresconis]MDN5658777.1 hypothetical protein [Brevibacterium sandarakinum]